MQLRRGKGLSFVPIPRTPAEIVPILTRFNAVPVEYQRQGTGC